MKKYESPEVNAIDFGMTENLNVAVASLTSGQIQKDPIEKPTGDWTITPEWRNHNSGSHSELAIIGDHKGNHSGESITMHFTVHGFELDTIKDSGGMIVSNVSKNGFTITRVNHFNANDHFEFNIQITATAQTTSSHGAVGVTGEACPGKYCTCCGYQD